jgi:hypothetical protein
MVPAPGGNTSESWAYKHKPPHPHKENRSAMSKRCRVVFEFGLFTVLKPKGIKKDFKIQGGLFWKFSYICAIKK